MRTRACKLILLAPWKSFNIKERCYFHQRTALTEHSLHVLLRQRLSCISPDPRQPLLVLKSSIKSGYGNCSFASRLPLFRIFCQFPASTALLACSFCLAYTRHNPRLYVWRIQLDALALRYRGRSLMHTSSSFCLVLALSHDRVFDSWIIIPPCLVTVNSSVTDVTFRKQYWSFFVSVRVLHWSIQKNLLYILNQCHPQYKFSKK